MLLVECAIVHQLFSHSLLFSRLRVIEHFSHPSNIAHEYLGQQADVEALYKRAFVAILNTMNIFECLHSGEKLSPLVLH